jgi:hypothetical protein
MPDPCTSRGSPESISREYLPEELLNIAKGSYTVLMAYDFRFRGIHLSVSDNSSTGSTHYWIDTSQYGRAGNVGFWKSTYDNDHDPFSMVARRLHTGTQSGVIRGCRDGYLRHESTAVYQDDGEAVSSYVYYGPLELGALGEEGLVEQITGVTDEQSGDIDWTIYTGDDVQAAYGSDPHESGEWNTPGVQNFEYPRSRGTVAFVKLANGETNNAWAIDRLQATVNRAGRRRK